MGIPSLANRPTRLHASATDLGPINEKCSEPLERRTHTAAFQTNHLKSAADGAANVVRAARHLMRDHAKPPQSSTETMAPIRPGKPRNQATECDSTREETQARPEGFEPPTYGLERRS